MEIAGIIAQPIYPQVGQMSPGEETTRSPTSQNTPTTPNTQEQPRNTDGAGQVDTDDRVAGNREENRSDNIRENEPDAKTKTGPQIEELTPEEKRRVQELKARDAEVRQHEQAHRMAGGQYVRGPVQYEYEMGPDGRRYAVGGEVQIDTSEIPDDPEATIRKAQIVRRAALAPRDPSPQDRRVAMEATQMEFEARLDLAREKAADAQERAQENSPERQYISQATTQPVQPILVNIFA